MGSQINMGILPTYRISDAQGGQEGALDLLELEIQMVVHLMWVLGIEPGLFARTASTLNY